MKIAVASLGNFRANDGSRVKQMLARPFGQRKKKISPYRMSKIEESVRTALQFFDGINSKNISLLTQIIDAKCVFDDLWSHTPKYITKNEIIAYFTQQFQSTNTIQIKVIEANNFGHKCVVKFELTDKVETKNQEYNCIGLFEVYSGLIKSISLYTKK